MVGRCGFGLRAGKAFLLAFCLAYPIAGQSQAASATAQLTITMSVQSSISLIFQNNPAVGSNGFCPLTNSGTNNVGLDLGTASFTGGDNLPCVAYTHLTAARYQVSSSFDLVVTKANSSSPNYRLSAGIATPPAANVVWLVNDTALTNTGFTLLDASDNYGIVTKTLQVQVKNPVPAQTLQETVTFLATAN
jgi:hypothetical protein